MSTSNPEDKYKEIFDLCPEKSYEDVKACVNAGFTSIMIDASHLPFEENIERTAKVVELAKKYCNPDASGFINAVLAKVEEP